MYRIYQNADDKAAITVEYLDGPIRLKKPVTISPGHSIDVTIRLTRPPADPRVLLWAHVPEGDR